jgi:alpha-glucosidase
MRPRTILLRVLLLLACASGLAAQEDSVRLRSPDGRIEFRLFNALPTTFNATVLRLAYSVTFRGKPLIDTSFLGFEIPAQIPLGEKLGVMNMTRQTLDETYSVPVGKARVVRNHYNSLAVEFLQEGSQGRLLTLEVRAFDDGVAFRYVVPWSPPLAEMLIENELTEFQFAQDAEAYPLLLRDFQSGYEDQFHQITLSAIHSDSLVGLPFLIEQPGVGWAAITEAYLEDYAGMYLRHADGRVMRAQLAPRVDGSGVAVRVNTPMATPWRVLLIASTAAELIESNIVNSLNPPTRISDTSWIHPGKTIAADLDTANVEFAAQNGLDLLIDQQWPQHSDKLPAVIASATQKNAGVWLGVAWHNLDGRVDETFATFEKWGVRGVRIDGMNRDDQSMVDAYRDVAQKAADHHLMVAFHGAFKPDGLSRSYPNVLTRDAAIGAEYLRSTAQVTPRHNVLLAFTRMLAGPMDYGPGGFNNVTREEFRPQEDHPMVMGTRAHQLALFVVFESPLQTLPGAADDYRNERDFDFIKAVPTTWDETRVLNGQVGKFVTIARRSGDEWYVGSITDWTATDFDVPLQFLGPGDYIAELYSDSEDAAQNPKRTSIQQLRVNSASVLKLRLASGGGAAARIRPAGY